MMIRWILLVDLLLSIAVLAQQPSGGSAHPAQWGAVDSALGRTGQNQPDGVHKYSLPRRDLKVTVDGLEVKAGLALGSWLSFSNMNGNTEVMGDLVLTEDEVTPVVDKLTATGIEITAIHNHLQHETPRVMYMHVHGRGDAETLARSLHDALAETKTPPPTPPAQAPELGIDTKGIDSIMGFPGKNNGGIYQFAVPRAEHIREGSMMIPNSAGIATAINFQPAGSGKAAITGDFVLTASEVNPVIKALHENGIAVTAVHSHMLDEQPRLFFMHFWANDDALKLAKGLRAALDQTNSARAK